MDQDACDWWRTKIIDMKAGVIRYRGYPIEELIGNTTFPQMIWLMLRGELPDNAQAALLDAALVSAVDHGPQAPSIAIARMAATCGVELNNAMASALNVLGDIHGGAGEQAMQLYQQIASQIADGATVGDAVKFSLDNTLPRGHYIPGFGHRFHPVDPRAPRLLQLVDLAVGQGAVSGLFAKIAREMESQLEIRKGRRIPINIDGATAVIYAELGFPPPLARGLFCLSRSVGILAHAWEQMEQGGRNKGPLPKGYTWTYDGPPRRTVPPPGDGGE
jgi:citrate synthase